CRRPLSSVRCATGSNGPNGRPERAKSVTPPARRSAAGCSTSSAHGISPTIATIAAVKPIETTFSSGRVSVVFAGCKAMRRFYPISDVRAEQPIAFEKCRLRSCRRYWHNLRSANRSRAAEELLRLRKTESGKARCFIECGDHVRAFDQLGDRLRQCRRQA